MVRGRWSVAVVLAVMGAARAEGTDPLAGSGKIQAEMEALARTPEVQRVLALEKQAGELYTAFDKQQEAWREEMRKAEDSPAWAAYVEKRDALAKERDDAWSKERDAMAAAAKTMYEARHKELLAHGAGELVAGRALGFEALTFPRIDGSTSTHPMAVIVAARLLGLSYAWDYPEPTGSPYPTTYRWMPERMLREAWYPSTADEEFTLVASRVRAAGGDLRGQRAAALVNNVLATNTATHDAYVHLIEGTCDVNLTARPPSESERKLAAEKGAGIELLPIGRDALVFIVHRDNPVAGLTLAQVRQIYGGKVGTWKEVGGLEEKMFAMSRERDSGSQELFDALVMKGAATAEGIARTEVVAGSMAGPFNRVTQEKGGLAYSVAYYERFMAMSPYTRTLAIDGVEPTAENVRSGKYPLIAPIYAAVRKDAAADSAARKLARYLQSAEGQKLLEEAGYVGNP
jgi:phosphate transport system substrate-binding protein